MELCPRLTRVFTNACRPRCVGLGAQSFRLGTEAFDFPGDFPEPSRCPPVGPHAWSRQVLRRVGHDADGRDVVRLAVSAPVATAARVRRYRSLVAIEAVYRHVRVERVTGIEPA